MSSYGWIFLALIAGVVLIYAIRALITFAEHAIDEHVFEDADIGGGYSRHEDGK